MRRPILLAVAALVAAVALACATDPTASVAPEGESQEYRDEIIAMFEGAHPVEVPLSTPYGDFTCYLLVVSEGIEILMVERLLCVEAPG